MYVRGDKYFMVWLDPETGENLGRSASKHRERGPTKYTYTYNDLASILGMKVSSLRNAHCRGDFEITDLLSVAEYICRKRGWVAPIG